MATAIFNTQIEAPRKGPNTYNLDTVITKTGFENSKDFSYTLTPMENVSLENSILSVEVGAYGKIEIKVLDRSNNSAIAETEIYGFLADRSKLLNNENYIKIKEDLRANWASIIP